MKININKLCAYNDEYGNKIIFHGESISEKIFIQFNGENNLLIIDDDADLITLHAVFGANGAVCKIGKTKAGIKFLIGEMSKLSIGDNFTATTPVYITCSEGNDVIIGADCMFSTGVQIRGDDSHPIFDINTGERVNRSKSVYIGDHVLLGFESIVMTGVSIGSGSVIGLRSVVTKNIPNNCVAVGVPAKIIKKNIAWERPHLGLTKPYFKMNKSDIKINQKYWNATDENLIFSKLEMTGNQDGVSLSDVDANQLINVALGKSATQSSYSKWSKKNDPQRAVLGYDNNDFAFHTEIENNPWWHLDLESCFLVDCIIVKNRKNGFKNKARTIYLEVSIDNLNWICIHRGIIFWQDKLLFELSGEIPVRYIKIGLNEKEYLHLSAVEVFVKKKKIRLFDEKRVIAIRSDGLGERLNAILNGLFFSKITGIDFGFSWPKELLNDPSHAIESIDEMFSKNFITKYLIDEKTFPVRQEISGKSLTFSSLNEKVAHADALIAPRLGLYEIFDKNILLRKSINYSEIFYSIEFSEKITKAINLAKNINLVDNAVGLHLRSGDVFYGPYRKWVNYTYKGLTIPIVKGIIGKLLKENKKIYLFGQDEDVIMSLCRDFDGCVINGNLLLRDQDISMGRAEKAVFDLVLLSRFSEIAAGSSGFAKQASWIGGGELRGVDYYFTAKEQVDISFSDLEIYGDLYHPLQTAFAYWYSFYIYRKSEEFEIKLKALEMAEKYDPKNELYPLVRAAVLFEYKKYKEGDIVLENLFNSRLNFINSVFDVFCAKTLGKYNMLEFHKNYYDAVENGSFFSQCLILYIEKKQFDLSDNLMLNLSPIEREVINFVTRK